MDRPTIIVLASASLDGRISLGPNRTQWEDMADPRGAVSEGAGDIWAEAEARLDALHSPQARMLGSASLVREGDPLEPLPPFDGDPTPLYEDYLPDDVVGSDDASVWLVAVDGRGRLRSGYKGEDNPGHHMLHLVSRGAPAEYLAFLQRERIPYLMTGEQQVDLSGAMEKLQTKLGIECLVCEGGGRLSGALLRAGLVDGVSVIFRPELIGGTRTPSLFDAPDLQPEEWPTALKLISAEVRANGIVWLQYETVPGAGS